MTTTFTTAELVEQIKAYAIENYEAGGWDFIVECWEDEDIAKQIGGAKTFVGAKRKFASYIDVISDRQADAEKLGVLMPRYRVVYTNSGGGFSEFTAADDTTALAEANDSWAGKVVTLWDVTKPEVRVIVGPKPVSVRPTKKRRTTVTNVRTYSEGYDWNQEAGENAKGEERYRYKCKICGHTGRWYADGNLADGDDHLYNVHKIGE